MNIEVLQQFRIGAADRNIRCWGYWHAIQKGDRVYWRKRPQNGRRAEGYCEGHAEAIVYTEEHQKKLIE